MIETYKAVQVTENVYWVGAIDWHLRDFHGYATDRGSTYNAFLVKADKLTLIDTVKAPFVDEMLARISSVADPSDIEIIVSNHAEMDHSGGIPQTVQAVKPGVVYASKQGVRALKAHRLDTPELTEIGDGESIDLGSDKLSFYETRMCHWPDSMVSYLHGARLMFSQDAFGMHLASNERFADEIDPGVRGYELAKYYANILMHLATFINKTLEKLGPLREQIDIVAPDHGPIYRRGEDIDHVLQCYARWASGEKSNRAIVVYDTMWQSTAKMARIIADGISEEGTSVKVMPLSGSHRSDVATEILDAGAIVVGSPTLNNGMFPTIPDVLTYLKGLKPTNLVGAAFGSYGWSGEAPKEIHQWLDSMGVDMIDEPLRAKYVPTDEELNQCRLLGQAVARKLQASLSEG